jgi:hypothetical protein
MNMHARTALMATAAASAVGLLSNPGAAQQPTTRVIPPSATTTDGPTASGYPFSPGVSTFDYYQIVEGRLVANINASLTQLAFRRDAQNRTVYLGGYGPFVSVIVGHSRRKPAQMSTTPNENYIDRTTVFNNSFVLPPQPVPTGSTAPFNVVYPFSKPFAYMRANGDLHLELHGNALLFSKNPFYDLDAHDTVLDGSWKLSGQHGAGAACTNSIEIPDVAQLTPGGTPVLRITNSNCGYTGFWGFGASTTRLGSTPLPWNLANAGAPGNFIYHSWDLALPFVMSRIMNTHNFPFEAKLPVPVPGDPRLYGAVGHVQALVADSNANPAGMVTTQLMTINLDRQMPVSQCMMKTSLVPRETFLRGSTVRIAAGPVLQFNGTFN